MKRNRLIFMMLHLTHYKQNIIGTSLAVQWLGLCTSTAEGPGSIPGWGTKILQAAQRGRKKKIIIEMCNLHKNC